MLLCRICKIPGAEDNRSNCIFGFQLHINKTISNWDRRVSYYNPALEGRIICGQQFCFSTTPGQILQLWNSWSYLVYRNGMTFRLNNGFTKNY